MVLAGITLATVTLSTTICKASHVPDKSDTFLDSKQSAYLNQNTKLNWEKKSQKEKEAQALTRDWSQ